MKKTIKVLLISLCVFALAIGLIACNEKCTEHVDDNKDNLCDKCGAFISSGNPDIAECTHVDKNLDEKCDTCGADVPLNDGKETYTVYVSDGIGGGFADVIVEFYIGTERVLMQTTDASGYSYARLALNKYTVMLIDTQSRNLYFGEGELEVTPTKKTLLVEASKVITSNAQVPIMESTYMLGTSAYAIKGEGSYVVDVQTDLITPLVWTAEKTGIYTFTFESSFGTYLTYNGIPYLTYENSLVKEENFIADNSFKMTVSRQNLAIGEGEETPYVIGVRAKVTAGTGVLKVIRIGDAPHTIYDEPWNNYPAAIPGALNLSEELSESNLKYFNLTTSHELVYNESDGLYHYGSADGDIVYIQLKHTPTTMPSATGDEPKDYFTIEALVENGLFGVYIFDEGGELLEKNSYQEHASACIENAHETAGIYYLTAGMMKGIKEYGEVNAWWDFDNERQIFGEKAGVTVLEEYAWMFLLCTIK